MNMRDEEKKINWTNNDNCIGMDVEFFLFK